VSKDVKQELQFLYRT